MMAGIVPTSITESANLADIDWKERCITLESQMNKFKTQATKIRDVLGEKMEELEQNVKTSTERAEKAEQQVIELQEKLSATKSHSAINNDDGDGDGIGILKECCKEKDEIIQNLETQIDEQRRLRHHESKLVETKAAKIKEWVTTKLESLEQENQQLRSANTESMEAIRKLQIKVDMYESNNSRRSIGVQYQPLSTAMEPSDLIERPSSLGMKEKKQDGSDPVLNVPWSPVHALIEAQRSRSESQATNTNNIESGKKGHTWPKRKLLNKSNSKELQVFDIDFSSQGKFEEARGLEESSDVADLNEPLYETLRTTKRENKLSAQPTSSVESPESSTGTPPMSVSPLTEESPSVANTGSPSLSMSPTFTANNTNSDLYAVPRKYKQSSSSSSSAGLSDGKEPYDNDIDDETGEPPMLPHRMTNIDIISIIEDDDIESETREGKMKPPTPPHRLPSWEDRIISMAASGMNLSQENLSLSVEDSDTAIYQTSEVSHTNQLYQEMQPPVYTILKGRAVQIRSTPYSGDSSDSDNDENSATSSMVTTSPTSVSMAMSLSSPKKSRTSTANKRGVSIQSNSSEGDYCMPPDAAPIMEDTEEYEQKLSKTTQPDSPRSTKDILEKSGYLTKLGGKVKSWKKRWFVLHNGQLVYYKSKNDISNKPLGQVPLDGKCKVMKSESSHSFEIVTSQRTYYLSAESNNAVDEWIQALQGVVSFQDGTYWDCSDNHGVMKGWLVKVKHGQHRKCWCMLVGKTLTSYKTPTDKIALESIDLQGKRVEEIDSRLNSDLLGVQKQLKYRVVIHFSSSNNQEPVYLLFSTKEDKDKWLYQLTLASTSGLDKTNTEYESLITKLMELDGDINNPLWKHPMLYYSKDSLDKTLTTLPTEGLKKEALKMFKSCQLFMGVTMDTPSIDYHVSLAQNIVQSCLTHPVLQSELYCQLIKQTSKRPHIVGKTQPSSSSSDHSSDAHKNPVFLQGWQLLGLCTTLFLPKQKYLCYLKIHLQRHADPRNEIGKYAVFCQRSLERTIQCGGREAKPSRMEVLSLLLRNPYHHSLPMSIPVHVLNASYQVVGFDGQTTVREFIQTLNHHISMRDVKQSGFALFTNDPSGKNIEHCLQLNVKLCDVISKWERTMIETGLGGGKTEAHKAIRLTYKNRLYFRSNTKTETDKEKLLLVYQTNQDIVSGRFPINTELTLELASLLAQIEYGDYKPSSKSVEFVIEKFCPKRLQDLTADKKKQLERNLLDKWLSLSGRSLMECVRLYLTVTRKLSLFSMQLFKAKCKYGKQQEVWIGVKDDGIYILNVKNMDVLESYTYKSVESFGGCRDDFMLIPSNQSKLLFSMTKPKIIDLTNLLSSYINAVHGI